jgi:septal ring factor EnvC (AmiA/AmiB activator)
MDNKLVSGKLQSTQRLLSDTSSSSTEKELKQLETRVMTKMAESVEELATIIKDYAKKNRKMNDRLGDLEARVFG